MIGERLKLARKKAGLSQDALVRKIDRRVSKQALSKYERDQMMPGTEVLGALCQALDVSVEYLMSDEVMALEGVDFRKGARTSVKDRARVEASVIEQVERYLAIESILELQSADWQVPGVPNPRLASIKDAERLADELRREWDLGIDPIPDMTDLLETHGIKVLMLDLPPKIHGLTCFVARRSGASDVPVIVVNQSDTLERRRLTLAHELCHRVAEIPENVDEERAAMRFAGAFLVSGSHLCREAGKGRSRLSHLELIELKKIYQVSAAALLMRFCQTGIIDEATLSTTFQTVGKRWRTHEPEEIEPEKLRGSMERPERFERLCYWALAEQFISPSKAMELLQKPLSEIELKIRGPAGFDADSR